jgi:hypothetical protein
MDPEKMPTMPETTPEEEEGKSEELKEEVMDAPIDDVINAVMDLPVKDLQQLYTAIGEVIKWKKKEPKPEEEPASEFNAQEMARSFM